MAFKKSLIALKIILLLVISASAEETSHDKEVWKTVVDISTNSLSTLGIPVFGDLMKLWWHQKYYDDREGDFRKKVFHMFTELDKNFKSNESLIFDQIDEQTMKLDLRNKLNIKLNEIEKLSNDIANQHSRFVEYLNSRYLYENDTLTKFADKNIDSDFVAKVHEIMKAPKHELGGDNHDAGLLELLAIAISSNNNFYCSGYSTSPQQTLVNFYWKISLIQNRAYIMTLFSYSILALFRKNDHNYANDVKLYHKQSMHMINDSKIQLLKTEKVVSNREYWRCNPVKHVEGVTYLQASNTLQAYVQYLKNQKGPVKYEPCTTAMLVDPKIQIDVCIIEYSLSRRYEFIKVTKESKLQKLLGMRNETETYGTETKCGTGRIRTFVHDDMMIPIVSICFDRDNDADRYFDLRPVLADKGTNKVVTGMRFVKKNRFFRLQIQQGELMAYGRINQSTVEWQKTDELSIYKVGISRDDFHELNELQMTIELGEITAKSHQIITGVMFVSKNGRLKIGAVLSDFDCMTGEVFYVNSTREYQSSNSNERLELYKSFPEKKLPYWIVLSPNGSIFGYVSNLNQPNLPTKSKKSSLISQRDQYITFTFSNLKNDAAQSTLPFFDSQDVTSQPAVPLQGIGLFLKGEKGFAGFLTLNIKTFDYFHMMKNRTTYQIVKTDDWLRRGQNSNRSIVKNQMDHSFNVVSTTNTAPSVTSNHPSVKDEMNNSSNSLNVVSTTTTAPSVTSPSPARSSESTFEKESQIKSVLTYAVYYDLILITTVLLIVCVLHKCKIVKFRRNTK